MRRLGWAVNDTVHNMGYMSLPNGELESWVDFANVLVYQSELTVDPSSNLVTKVTLKGGAVDATETIGEAISCYAFARYSCVGEKLLALKQQVAVYQPLG
mmetsp:Transcript_16577/g.56520  ORF Transcript_16577/g.56520 Transcript_16577/m.56520 type:complete len:100 (+) Transcript_16577:76-375(+)